ncbi:hypothetical protein [Halobacillus massiliensis]|nr:hypothetical protein [Halobacillus massiliensis]
MRRFLLGVLLLIVLSFSFIGYTEMDHNPAPPETSEQQNSFSEF